MAVSSVRPSVMDVRKATTKLRLLTGSYSLQSNRAQFNQHANTNCLLCGLEPETRLHFLCECPSLAGHRESCTKELQEQAGDQMDVHINQLPPAKRLTLILDPQLYAIREGIALGPLHSRIETSTRNFCYRMHNERKSQIDKLPVNTKAGRKPRATQRPAPPTSPTLNPPCPPASHT